MIEMCFIAPILVCIVFVAINLCVIAINESLVMSRDYVWLYTTCENMEEGDSFSHSEAAAESVLDSGLIWADSSDVYMLADGSGKTNACVVSVTADYTEELPGVALMALSGKTDKSEEVSREQRYIGKRLRRWQVYGELLSE